MNAIINKKYSRLPENLRAWKSATRIERISRRQEKTDSENTTIGSATNSGPA